jgi:hypothetical protein
MHSWRLAHNGVLGRILGYHQRSKDFEKILGYRNRCSVALLSIHYYHPAAFYGAITEGRFPLCDWSLVSAVGIYHGARFAKRRCQSVLGACVGLSINNCTTRDDSTQSIGAGFRWFLFNCTRIYDPGVERLGRSFLYVLLLSFPSGTVLLILHASSQRAVSYLRIRNHNLSTSTQRALAVTSRSSIVICFNSRLLRLTFQPRSNPHCN